MYKYEWDAETGGLLLLPEPEKMSLEPRPVYYRELDILGFDKYWNYKKDDTAPLMWATSNNYIYRGRLVAKTKGGALYTPPKLEIIEEPEVSGAPLRPVDIAAMTAKNAELMETLEQDTIQRIYNTYRKYKYKVDVFYVAFSGGKDSVVTLDLVQRALPHDEFMVLFGDTGMEFPDTYDVIKETEKWCEERKIKFLKAHSKLEPFYTWQVIGPPAQRLRWCCGVHKTAPQIILLRKLTNNPNFRGMAMMGVRADESVSRSHYKELSFGTKHQGQYDFYPILQWNSSEVFMYIFSEDLNLNQTYKYGNSRAGCLVCPMEAIKNTWFKNQTYGGDYRDKHTTTFYNHLITNNTIAKEMNKNKIHDFMKIGVWKSRHSGNKLIKPRISYQEEINNNSTKIILNEIKTDWKEWIKTLGDISFESENEVNIHCDDITYKLKHQYKIISSKHNFCNHSI